MIAMNYQFVLYKTDFPLLQLERCLISTIKITFNKDILCFEEFH